MNTNTNTREGITEIHDWIESQIDITSSCFVCAAEGDEDSPRALYYEKLYTNLTHCERVVRDLLSATAAA